MQLPDLREPSEQSEARMRWVQSVLKSLDQHAVRFGLGPEEVSKVFLAVAVSNARARGLPEPLVQQTVNEAMSYFRDMVH